MLTLTVGVSPAARGREATLGPLDSGLQVAHNAAVVGADVALRNRGDREGDGKKGENKIEGEGVGWKMEGKNVPNLKCGSNSMGTMWHWGRYHPSDSSQ